MSDTRKRELRDLLARHRAKGLSQAKIAGEAGVSQPLVSLAATGKLVAETIKVKKLFEYLLVDGPPSVAQTEPDGNAVDFFLKDALDRLTDGSVDGDIRLVRLLNAIAGIRLRTGQP